MSAQPSGVTSPFEIDTDPATGARVADNGAQRLVCTEPDAVVFRRRGVKGAGTADAKNIEWAVAEIAGVRVYFDGTSVVVSRSDIHP